MAQISRRQSTRGGGLTSSSIVVIMVVLGVLGLLVSVWVVSDSSSSQVSSLMALEVSSNTPNRNSGQRMMKDMLGGGGDDDDDEEEEEVDAGEEGDDEGEEESVEEGETYKKAEKLEEKNGGDDDDDDKENEQPEPEGEAEAEKGTSSNFEHKVHFVHQKDVTQQDSFSASWLQSKKDFLDMPLDLVGICEDAAFKAWVTRRHKLRMALDYLDFSVEHLSKWWKHLDFYEQPTVYNSIMSKLHNYVNLAVIDQLDGTAKDEELILKQTLVTIAFQPYSAPRHLVKRAAKNPLPVERAHNLTIVSMAATIESLRRAEMGRIMVIGSDDKHKEYAQETFDYLHQRLPHLSYTGSLEENNLQIGHLELGFFKITERYYRTKRLERNMPRGSLIGAKEAFLLANKKETQPLQDTEQSLLHQWMGTKQDPKYWQYLYLTEPDTLLVSRREALKQIKAEIDAGGIASPFRLVPVPHESDIPGFPHSERFLHLTDGFEVVELDHTDEAHDVCCDERLGKDSRPGQNNFPSCGNKKWFMCGFQPNAPGKDRHERLRPYKLIRLTKGTGLTLIGGNLFGRRCFPAKASQCEPYHSAHGRKRGGNKRQ